MSYFDDQFDEWMENDCQGSPEDYHDFSGLIAKAEREEKKKKPKPKKKNTT